jgi:hypothetical protein
MGRPLSAPLFISDSEKGEEAMSSVLNRTDALKVLGTDTAGIPAAEGCNMQKSEEASR